MLLKTVVLTDRNWCMTQRKNWAQVVQLAAFESPGGHLPPISTHSSVPVQTHPLPPLFSKNCIIKWNCWIFLSNVVTSLQMVPYEEQTRTAHPSFPWSETSRWSPSGAIFMEMPLGPPNVYCIWMTCMHALATLYGSCWIQLIWHAAWTTGTAARWLEFQVAWWLNVVSHTVHMSD